MHILSEIMVKFVHKTFIYIDLADSLACAERLGTVAYSQLLEHCFTTCTSLLEHYPEVDIYQFLGDAILLTVDKVEDIGVGLHLFFEFRAQLAQQKWSAWTPIFRAGIAAGMVAEKEYQYRSNTYQVYEGVAISLAARLEKLAGHYDVPLLVEGNLGANLGLNAKKWEQQLIENVVVRGFVEPISVYAVCRK